jgi:hypothetical protein
MGRVYAPFTKLVHQPIGHMHVAQDLHQVTWCSGSPETKSLA